MPAVLGGVVLLALALVAFRGSASGKLSKLPPVQAGRRYKVAARVTPKLDETQQQLLMRSLEQAFGASFLDVFSGENETDLLYTQTAKATTPVKAGDQRKIGDSTFTIIRIEEIPS